MSIVRFFTVYGLPGRPDLAHLRFVQWISEGRPVRVNGDGEQSRGFTYIDDIARGTILALKPVGYEVINLGGHEVITINNLIKLIEEVVGKKADGPVWSAQPGGYVHELGGCDQGGPGAWLGAAIQHARRCGETGGMV